MAPGTWHVGRKVGSTAFAAFATLALMLSGSAVAHGASGTPIPTDPPAPKQTADQIAAYNALPAAVRLAVADYNKHALTAADEKVLAGYPDIEAGMIDPSLSTSQVTVGTAYTPTTQPPPSGHGIPQDVAASTCRGFDGYRQDRAKLYPHDILYRWHKHLDVCYNGSTVTRINQNYYYVTNRDFTYFDRGVKSNFEGSPGASSLYTYTRGEMEQCFLKWGCIFGSSYPHIAITAYANGTANFNIGED